MRLLPEAECPVWTVLAVPCPVWTGQVRELFPEEGPVWTQTHALRRLPEGQGGSRKAGDEGAARHQAM